MAEVGEPWPPTVQTHLRPWSLVVDGRIDLRISRSLSGMRSYQKKEEENICKGKL